MASPQDFDRTFLERAGRELFAEGLRNQLYDEMPLFRLIMAGAETAQGTALIHKVPLYRNVANGLVGGYGPMVTQEQVLIANANLAWANIYYANISISMDEILENSGRQGVEKLVDLLRTKTNGAKMQLKENVYNDLYAARTTDGVYNTLVGLGAVCSASNTYAGIDRSASGNSSWQANVYSTTVSDDTLLDPTTRSTYFPSILRRQWKAASHDKSPDIIVTTKNLYELLEYIAERNNLQLQGNVAHLSFNKIGMPGESAQQKQMEPKVVWDTYCTAKKVFGLTTSDFRSWKFSGVDFQPVDVFGDGNIWQRGDKQLAGYMTIAWKGQLLCEVPRQQYICTTLGS